MNTEDRLLAMAEPLVGSSDTEGVGLLPNNKLDIARLADANVAESSSDCISGALVFINTYTTII